MNIRPLLAILSAAVLEASCATSSTSPPPPASTGSMSLPDTTELPDNAEISALLPEPHAYSIVKISENEYSGAVPRPAYVELSLRNDVFTATLLRGSGDLRFDKLSLGAATRSLFSYGVTPEESGTALICVAPRGGCAAMPAWSGTDRLRPLSDVQRSFDHAKFGLISVYNSAARRHLIDSDGMVKLDFTVESTGILTHCFIAESSFGSKDFNRALEQRVCAIPLAPSDSSRTGFYHYPIDFHSS